MGTRNNPSPGGLRPGLEATNKKTRREPVRSSNLAKVANASDAGDQVATGNVQNQSHSKSNLNSSTFDFRASVPQPDDEEPLAMSIERTETRNIKPAVTRRHNTRSTSRSVSPSLLHPENTESSKGKGKGRARSTSASSHQGGQAKGARGPKRGRAASEDRDDVGEKTSKRVKSSHKDPTDRPQPEPRKRNLRKQIPDSPIPEVPEEEDLIDEKVVKKPFKPFKPVKPHEHQFSYAPILEKYPYPSPQQPSQPTEEPSRQIEPAPSRTPQTTSNELALIPAPAEADYVQRSDDESDVEISQQLAICDAPNSSTPQQTVVERTDVQSNGRRSGARDVVQERSTPRNRSASSPPLPTLKHPHPSIRATATGNGSPVLRQGLMDIRVAQGSARKSGAELPSDSATRKTYSQEHYNKPRSRIRHPTTKAILSLDPMPIFEDSEHEDDSENEAVPRKIDLEEHKAWKQDLRTARSTFVKVLLGDRLPEPGSSIKDMDPRIARRKPGETLPAPRERENRVPNIPPSNYVIFQGSLEDEIHVLTGVRNTDELLAASQWSQERGNSVMEAIEFFEASRSRKTNRVRSAAPSPASQRGNSQPPSMSLFHRNPSTNREVLNRTPSGSLQLSNGEVAVRRNETNEAAEDNESTASFEENNDNMSDKTSEVGADEATPILPTTPTATPSQRASEPGGWSSMLTTVKKAVSTPFKFFGRTPNAAETATTNLNKPEFTFSHPHKPAEQLTTPTRSNKQHAKPQSERRGSTNNERRVSFQGRGPQTERLRRHIDRSTPLHLRGVPTARDIQDLHTQQASTRQRQRDEDMATLEENELSHGKTFRAPSPSSESDDDDDDTTTMTDNDDGEPSSPPKKIEYRFLPQTVQSPRKVHFEPESTSNTSHEIQNFSLTKPATSLNFPTAAEVQAAQAARPAQPTPSRILGRSQMPKPKEHQEREAWNALITNPALSNPFSRFQVPSENGDSPFYYVKANDYQPGQYYRKCHMSDPDVKFYNMFGTEAFWFKLNSGVFMQLNHGSEAYMRGQQSTKRWDDWMQNPDNLVKEKKALLKKWAEVPDEHKPLLLPGIRPFYKKLMEIGEFAPGGTASTGTATASSAPSTATSSGTSNITLSGTTSANSASRNLFSSTSSAAPSSGTASASSASSNLFSGTSGAATSSGTATASGASSNIFSRIQSTATSSGTNSAANSSGTYKFPEDDESDEEEDDVEPALADQAQSQTPPPKPRPGNAQLPQSQPQPQLTPARAALAAALANANKHRPSAPSNLRNVTQMSPLQQPDQENRENTNENGVNGIMTKNAKWATSPAKESISKRVIETEEELRKRAAAEEAAMSPAERQRQLDEVWRDLAAIPDEDMPIFVLPKAQRMQFPQEEGVDWDDINATTKAAFDKNFGGFETNGGY